MGYRKGTIGLVSVGAFAALAFPALAAGSFSGSAARGSFSGSAARGHSLGRPSVGILCVGRLAEALCWSMFWPREWATGPERSKMDQLLLAKLTLRRDELRELVGRKEAAVKKAPAGTLRYGRRKKDFEYYWRPPGAQTYSYIAKKNRKFAADLAQKGYDERILKAAKKELKLINKLIKACGKDEIDAAYDECPEGRKALNGTNNPPACSAFRTMIRNTTRCAASGSAPNRRS